MFTTPLCRANGIEHQIFCAGIVAAAGPELLLLFRSDPTP